MKIDSSAVMLTSERKYVKAEMTTTDIRRLTAEEKAAQNGSSLAASDPEGVLLSLGGSEDDLRSKLEETRLNYLKSKLGGPDIELSRLSEEQEISLVEQILNAMDRKHGKKSRFKSARRTESGYSGMKSIFERTEALAMTMQKLGGRMSGAAAGQAAAYSLTRTTVKMESEATSFTAQGIARTQDGREITFNVDVSMTREFVERSSFSAMLTATGQMVDPLVINLDGNAASVRDQKFLFDIDADGDMDSISRLGPGSGFLALDKNADGVVNDGSELFGARTGNGFAELSAYDEDGNGWIDENDSVFNDLKVWIQDADGSERLVAIAKADVGAIYLGSAGTDFSLTDAANNTDAMIRRSGVYLKESGGAGTVQHVDFAV